MDILALSCLRVIRSHEKHVELDEVQEEHSSDESNHEVNVDESQLTEKKWTETSSDKAENDSTLNEIIEAAEVLEIIK